MRGASPDDGHLTEERRTSEREQDTADLSVDLPQTAATWELRKSAIEAGGTDSD